MGEYHQREIWIHGRYVQCQILNWNEGPPPHYIVCNPLDPLGHFKEPFIAHQTMGTWGKIELDDMMRRFDLRPLNDFRHIPSHWPDMKLNPVATKAARDSFNTSRARGADGTSEEVISAYLRALAAQEIKFAKLHDQLNSKKLIYLTVRDYGEVICEHIVRTLAENNIQFCSYKNTDNCVWMITLPYDEACSKARDIIKEMMGGHE